MAIGMPSQTGSTLLIYSQSDTPTWRCLTGLMKYLPVHAQSRQRQPNLIPDWTLDELDPLISWSPTLVWAHMDHCRMKQRQLTGSGSGFWLQEQLENFGIEGENRFAGRNPRNWPFSGSESIFLKSGGTDENCFGFFIVEKDVPVGVEFQPQSVMGYWQRHEGFTEVRTPCHVPIIPQFDSAPLETDFLWLPVVLVGFRFAI